MNIGIDATSWWNNRGFGRFTRELLSAMFLQGSAHRFCLFVDQPPEPAMIRDNVEVLRVNSTRPTTDAAVAGSNRSAGDLFRLYRAVAARAPDIMFFPAVYSWFPVPRGLPTMVTLHDAIAEHYPELIFDSRRSRWLWSLKIQLALRSCQRVLTVSRAAKSEIVDYLQVDPAIIDVTSEAPGKVFKSGADEARIQGARQRAGLPPDARLVIYVGGFAPHKNLDGLLRGFALAARAPALDDVHLALVGDPDGAGFYSNSETLYRQVQADERLRDRVHFTGYLTDDDLVALYSTALALAIPSFSEGFGLPAVEAMACAAPVLASNRGSLPEVVGEAGLFFDPADVAAIASAIIELATDSVLREKLSRIAVSRAAQFTWSGCAASTLSHLERMQSGRA